MSQGPHCRNLCNRLFKCSYYREAPSYGKLARKVFARVLTKVRDSEETFLEAFAKVFSTYSYSGQYSIPEYDRATVKEYLLQCSEKISDLLDSYKVTNILEKYNYKWKVHGEIDGILHSKKEFNLHLEFMNETVDFPSLNSYIYNQSKGKSNDLLIFQARSGTFIKVPYSPEDYTIGDGFFKLPRRHKLRIRGSHCFGCLNRCKAQFIRDLRTLELYV